MASLELDKFEKHMFEHTASGYGAVITGGTVNYLGVEPRGFFPWINQ